MTDMNDKERQKTKRLLTQATAKKHEAWEAGNRLETERWAKATEALSKALGDGPLVGASCGPHSHLENE